MRADRREPDRAVDLQQIGDRIGVSQRTLSRLFADELAMTYPQWRTQLRLHHAVLLLAEHHDVTSVALKCGWATPSAFIDTYRRAFGRTPGARRPSPDRRPAKPRCDPLRTACARL